MFLRPYRPADKRFLQQLFFDTIHAVNARDYSPEQLNTWAPVEPNREVWARLEDEYCYVVEYQKILVGFGSLTQDGLVDFLYVHKNFQGRGIATTLLKQIERIARKKRLSLLETEASITARGFFEKVGFKAIAENRKLLHGLEFCNYSMQKSLPLPAANNI